jgi:diaminopimelate epimerase
MPALPFQKGQALGNDYLVVDRADLSFEFTPALARALCDRHRGAGSDGVLIADLSDGFELRIMNPDGSPAEKSGNGLRIFAAYLHGRGLVGNEWFEVALVKDRVRMRVEEALGGGVLQIRAEMGRASFDGRDIGFHRVQSNEGAASNPGEVLGERLALEGGDEAEITTVSLANPHCVVFVDALDRADFLLRAPQLCTHVAFAAGTNVQFARVKSPHDLEAWIWERGVGETLASGSSACAVAAAAVRRGFVQPGTFTVHMQGGEAEVEVAPDYFVRLRGPAQIVYAGEVSGPVVEGWRGVG